MSAPTPAIDAAVEHALDVLQRDWPATVELRLTPRSTFDALVFQLLPAFPEVSATTAEAIARACRLFAASILVHDRLLDGDIHSREVGVAAMRMVAMQHEAYRALHELFPPDRPFWSRFRAYLTGYAVAFAEEARFRHADSLDGFTVEIGLGIAIAKHGIAKAVVAALVESSGREDLLDPLCASIDGVAVAFQMHDDLEDWRLDLWARLPSVLIARLPAACWNGPPDGAWEPFYDRVANHVYGGGAAATVLGLARDALARCDLRGVPAAPWHQLIAGLSARCARMLETLAATAARTRRAAPAEASR